MQSTEKQTESDINNEVIIDTCALIISLLISLLYIF